MISETTGAGRLTKQPESWLHIPGRREYTPILLLGVAASQIQTCVAPMALAVVFAAHPALARWATFFRASGAASETCI